MIIRNSFCLNKFITTKFTDKSFIMPLQYVSDSSGSTVAVQIPIEDWKILKDRYEQNQEIPAWHKNIIDERIKQYQLHPEAVTSLDDFIQELNMNEDAEI